MKKLIFSVVVLVAITSCQSTLDNVVDPSENMNKTEMEINKKSIYLKEFSAAFAKAINKYPQIRSIVKDEALKMFDNDYDVLYAVIKSEKIGESTLEEILLTYLDENQLSRIEQEMPTLTIFVPTLPEDSFSATNWNVITQIPKVAYTSKSDKSMHIVDSDGIDERFSPELIPGFPVVVVKENERIKKPSKGISFKGKNPQYEFIDEIFRGNGEKTYNRDRESTGPRGPNQILDGPDTKAIYAANEYADYDGWQRDYVYYNITPTNQNGAFKNDYQEHIRFFKINDLNSLNRIIDQNDPTYSQAGWADGFLEFKITALINGKNGVGNSIEKYVAISPNKLFWFYYTKVGNNYQITDSRPLYYNLELPLINWDLMNYSQAIKLTFEEVDSTEEITRTETVKSTLVTNFGIDAGVDIGIVKLGVKGGITSTEESTSTYTIKTYVGSDPMGDVIIQFGDKILSRSIRSTGGIRGGSGTSYSYARREYNSGNYTVIVEPKKVQ